MYLSEDPHRSGNAGMRLATRDFGSKCLSVNLFLHETLPESSVLQSELHCCLSMLLRVLA